MTIFIFPFILLLFAWNSLAALPPQFSECFVENSSTNLSVTDLKDIARVSKVTYCQNQVGLVGKPETLDLLRSPNIQVGISVSRTSYTATDFVDLARAGSYVLYVDGTRLPLADLITIANAGAQLVVVSASAGLSKADLLALAAAKPFILNVNSLLTRIDLRDYVTAGIQVVIRASQSGLSRADIMEAAQANANMVTLMP
ncbi:hypothetical protein QJS83_17385 [Bdellovibrio sp. 22V]|uniref:hypothetical protein n=1 Tax=Bdellovibrio sp. 22V TaxID=3044166 RepID=UPI002543CA3B|nr:hypothetical protein [Bdellovibrio sp. 22V]WII72239.1 hypothetical protein QJS83_17385 [Bdellovibrio sp. 22V]